ncbi:unnamed protein product, partial [Ixodes hexagonus]
MASGSLPVQRSRQRPSSADTPSPGPAGDEDRHKEDDGRLPALPSRPLSSSGSRAKNGRHDSREERRRARKGRLERDLKLTSELLRQANKELSRKDSTITHLNRHNDRLRGKVVRLESDVAVYKASAATSSDEDCDKGDGGHVCCVQDRELLKALTGIYSKMQKTDDVRKDSQQLPDAKLVEQVFSKFWQDYMGVSRELESCKQMVAYQELKIQDLEAAARCRFQTNHSEADSAVQAQKLSNLHRGREVSQAFLLIDDLQQDSKLFRDASEKKGEDVAPTWKDAAEERRLRQCVNRLQHDNNRLLVLNKELSEREVATKKELRRVQSKVSLGILLDELVALRRQNIQLKAFQQQHEQELQQQHQRPKSTTIEKVL